MNRKLTSHKQVQLPVFAVMDDTSSSMVDGPNSTIDASSITEAQMITAGLTLFVCAIIAFLYIAWDMRNDSIKLEATRKEILQHKVDTERESADQIKSIKEIIGCKQP